MNPSKPPVILVVDDDEALQTLLINYLSGYGMQVHGASTAAEAQKAVSSLQYDLVLLDMGLPDGDGMELARRWRADHTISIICVTGRIEEADRVMGLELGADDYITKPFSLREVLARIRAVTRRIERSVSPASAIGAESAMAGMPHTSPVTQWSNGIGGSGGALPPTTRNKHPRAYHFAGWSLNLNTRRLLRPEGQQVSLTNAEFNLLAVFLGVPKRIVSREQLLERTRAFDDIFDRAIDVQILRLRRKLEIDAKNPKLLCTERGVGYFLNTEVEAVWE